MSWLTLFQKGTGHLLKVVTGGLELKYGLNIIGGRVTDLGGMTCQIRRLLDLDYTHATTPREGLDVLMTIQLMGSSAACSKHERSALV